MILYASHGQYCNQNKYDNNEGHKYHEKKSLLSFDNGQINHLKSASCNFGDLFEDD
jgi:hypothetical protein